MAALRERMSGSPLLLALIVLASLATTLAQRGSTNVCTSANYDYNINQSPASAWYYRGSGNDAYCNANPLLKQYLCNAVSPPVCSDATKSQTCAAATNPVACNAAPRVFSVLIDSDCDFIVYCEYIQGTPTATPAPPVQTPAPPLPTLPVPVTTQPPVSLAPKVGDALVQSAFATGSVEYTCTATVPNANGRFDNGTLSATLYSLATGTVLGNLTTFSTLQGLPLIVFNLTNGSVVVDPSTSRTFPSPTSIPADGGYGSLNQTYYLATGTGGLAAVKYATVSGISGGVLPVNAPCRAFTFPLQTTRPWRVPYEATYNLFSAYTLP